MSTSVYTEPFRQVLVAPVVAQEATTVSVVIPCFNEERFIGNVLENLANQYDSEHYEIIVVDAVSEDRTREVIAAFCQSHPEITVTILDNPERSIPRALNLGIAAARGEIIARIDAHAVASAGYIRRCVQLLLEDRAAVVGMTCRVRPGAGSAMAHAIAIGVSHSFGIGDAKYRLGSAGEKPEFVDTVAFACFRKSLWVSLGGFDEKLLTNEDYDFNYRVKFRGERVLLDRSEHCDYFARTTPGSLAHQYWRYGCWKAQMIKQHPGSMRLRHLVAPAFVTSIALLVAIGVWQSIFWALVALELAVYLLVATTFSYQGAKRNGERLRVMLAMPLVFFTIHFCWGTSFLVGLIRRPR